MPVPEESRSAVPESRPEGRGGQELPTVGPGSERFEQRLQRLDAWDAAWTRPDARYPRAEALRLLVTRGILLLLCLVPLVLTLTRVWHWWLWLAVALPALVLVEAVVRLVLVPRAARARGYAERADDLLVRRGIVFHTLTVVPYGRLQYVEVSSTPWGRLFGLSRVELHTASASTDAVLEGVAHDEAVRLREEISRRGRDRLAGL